jgi:hypothetical protein
MKNTMVMGDDAHSITSFPPLLALAKRHQKISITITSMATHDTSMSMLLLYFILTCFQMQLQVFVVL